ncbi:MAG TPA: FMN-binding protein [Candidatus Dormibacteraeota bacterium]|nr:FMN-binding protein [Candidatus Dormibacteraeota bacterium]
MMKKALLTSFVVVTFILYSFHQRNDGSSTVIKPTSTPATQTTSPPTTTNTGTGNPSSSTSTSTTAAYKDGQYTGSSADAYYGFIQVLAVISGGKLTDVRFLQYPNDRSNSIYINSQAMPYLKQEALQAQSGNVNIVSGATDTSQAFIQSLSSALDKAKS